VFSVAAKLNLVCRAAVFNISTGRAAAEQVVSVPAGLRRQTSGLKSVTGGLVLLFCSAVYGHYHNASGNISKPAALGVWAVYRWCRGLCVLTRYRVKFNSLLRFESYCSTALFNAVATLCKVTFFVCAVALSQFNCMAAG
jgi:hypothetical protein